MDFFLKLKIVWFLLPIIIIIIIDINIIIIISYLTRFTLSDLIYNLSIMDLHKINIKEQVSKIDKSN